MTTPSLSSVSPTASGFNVALTPGSFVNLSSLFTWSDANVADSVVAFAVDLTSGGGHLWLAVEGSPLLLEPDNQLFDSVSISQLGALPPFWLYQVGPAGAVDQISFNAIDSHGNYSTTVVTTITASPSALPDLSVSNVTLSSPSVSAGDFEQVGFNWDFAGEPPDVVGPQYTWTAGVYLSNDPIIDSGDIFLGNFPSPFTVPVGSGGGVSAGFAIPSNLSAGTYYIGVIVDNGNTVAEANESNNASIGVRISVTEASTNPALFPFTGDPLSQVEALYVGYFGRAGDPAGVNFWMGNLGGGQSIDDVAMNYAKATEAENLYPFLQFPTTDSDSFRDSFVKSIYQDLFNRGPDTGGLNYWKAELQHDQQTLSGDALARAVGGFILEVIRGAGNNSAGLDQTTIANKVTVADFLYSQFTAAGINFDNTSSPANLFAHTDIAGVTSDLASVTAAEAAVTAFVSIHPAAASQLVGIATVHDLLHFA